MLTKCKHLERMFRGGYFPQSHGEWVDAYNGTSNPRGVSGTIAVQTFFANDRFVIVEP